MKAMAAQKALLAVLNKSYLLDLCYRVILNRRHAQLDRSLLIRAAKVIQKAFRSKKFAMTMRQLTSSQILCMRRQLRRIRKRRSSKLIA